MPRGNGTGPMGMGRMSGRKAGYCAGFEMAGFQNRGMRLGMAAGQGQTRTRGGGRGWRHQYFATGLPGWMRAGGGAATQPQSNPELEKKGLEHCAAQLQEELDLIKQRLAGMSGEDSAQ